MVNATASTGAPNHFEHRIDLFTSLPPPWTARFGAFRTRRAETWLITTKRSYVFNFSAMRRAVIWSPVVPKRDTPNPRSRHDDFETIPTMRRRVPSLLPSARAILPRVRDLACSLPFRVVTSAFAPHAHTGVRGDPGARRPMRQSCQGALVATKRDLNISVISGS